MTIPELIEILKAAEEGKVIEYQRIDGTWYSVVTGEESVRSFAQLVASGFGLRVKPEPREWWAGLYSQGRDGQLFSSEAEARRMCPNGEIVRVREI